MKRIIFIAVITFLASCAESPLNTLEEAEDSKGQLMLVHKGKRDLSIASRILCSGLDEIKDKDLIVSRLSNVQCVIDDEVDDSFYLRIFPSTWEISSSYYKVPFEPYDYGNDSNVPGSLGAVIEQKMSGLKNHGYPTPLAPGMIREWKTNQEFSGLIELQQSYAHLFSASELRDIRDKLGCEILQTYNSSYKRLNSQGVLQIIGEVRIMPDISLCGGTTVLLFTVKVGNFTYRRQDDDNNGSSYF